MTPQLAVHIVGQALMAAFWICAPLLVISFALGIVINLVQIATSMQDPVFSTVPRLAACVAGFLLFLPWMLKHAMSYAAAILGNLAQYAR
ncbi:MAG: flagellar biosynthetic protein FliQ [Acidobacteriaceae bacterium]|nr:flagellar biosynthetic protein FliQ [Acidobacteriaceae bacterium]MBV8572358.1 flagellar biosynthetic protein FliQ [Acidobacteriaceae bacterium]